jgi:hypothetical protein
MVNYQFYCVEILYVYGKEKSVSKQAKNCLNIWKIMSMNPTVDIDKATTVLSEFKTGYRFQSYPVLYQFNLKLHNKEPHPNPAPKSGEGTGFSPLRSSGGVSMQLYK